MAYTNFTHNSAYKKKKKPIELFSINYVDVTFVLFCVFNSPHLLIYNTFSLRGSVILSNRGNFLCTLFCFVHCCSIASCYGMAHSLPLPKKTWFRMWDKTSQGEPHQAHHRTPLEV